MNQVAERWAFPCVISRHRVGKVRLGPISAFQRVVPGSISPHADRLLTGTRTLASWRITLKSFVWLIALAVALVELTVASDAVCAQNSTHIGVHPEIYNADDTGEIYSTARYHSPRHMFATQDHDDANSVVTYRQAHGVTANGVTRTLPSPNWLPPGYRLETPVTGNSLPPAWSPYPIILHYNAGSPWGWFRSQGGETPWRNSQPGRTRPAAVNRVPNRR